MTEKNVYITTTTCDRCGKTLETKCGDGLQRQFISELGWVHMIEDGFHENCHLCPECYSSYKEWKVSKP